MVGDRNYDGEPIRFPVVHFGLISEILCRLPSCMIDFLKNYGYHPIEIADNPSTGVQHT
jgi:hypothetical protein